MTLQEICTDHPKARFTRQDWSWMQFTCPDGGGGSIPVAGWITGKEELSEDDSVGFTIEDILATDWEVHPEDLNLAYEEKLKGLLE